MFVQPGTPFCFHSFGGMVTDDKHFLIIIKLLFGGNVSSSDLGIKSNNH